MGATLWYYYIPYQPDIRAAVRSYQEELFATGGYHFPGPEEARPADLDELWRADAGDTHSLLDIRTVYLEVHPGVLDGRFDEPPRCIMPLPSALLAAEFPEQPPSLARAAAVIADGGYTHHELWDIPRYVGFYLEAYELEKPAMIMVWGSSGD